MNRAVVESLYDAYVRLRALLEAQNEPSLLADVEKTQPKVLLLAAASAFEAAVTDQIRSLYEGHPDANPVLVEFVMRKALSRQYHTLFSWEAANVNAFWSLFGPEFSTYAKKCVNSDSDLEDSVRSFLQVGSLRNSMVHQNFATYVLDRTVGEVLELFNSGAAFVDALPRIFSGFEWSEAEDGSASA